MQTERIVLRPRGPGEAIELGFHLTRANWASQIGLISVLLIPITLVGYGLSLLFSPLLLLTVAWFKPSLDRALLHQLSNNLLERPSSVSLVLKQWRQWWRGGHLVSLLWQRFNFGRSAVLPIWQLEQLSSPARRRRAHTLSYNDRGAAITLSAFAVIIEFTFLISIVSALVTVAPDQWTQGLDFFDWLAVASHLDLAWLLLGLAYLPVVMLIEPFYVGAGFGLYLNRRSHLECWDLEPKLKALVERHGRRVGR